MFTKDHYSKLSTQETDYKETPRFETPKPTGKKKRKCEEKKITKRLPMQMKKHSSWEPYFSNSQMMSDKIKFQREIEEGQGASKEMKFRRRAKKQY